MLPSPTLILGGLLAALALALGAYAYGIDVERARCQAAAGAALAGAVERHESREAAGDKALGRAYRKAAAVEGTYNRLDKEADTYADRHPAPAGCGLDADGLRLWAAADRGDPEPAAGEGNAAPGADAGATREGHAGSIAGRPRAGDADRAPLAGAAGSPAGVGGGDDGAAGP